MTNKNKQNPCNKLFYDSVISPLKFGKNNMDVYASLNGFIYEVMLFPNATGLMANTLRQLIEHEATASLCLYDKIDIYSQIHLAMLKDGFDTYKRLLKYIDHPLAYSPIIAKDHSRIFQAEPEYQMCFLHLATRLYVEVNTDLWKPIYKGICAKYSMKQDLPVFSLLCAYLHKLSAGQISYSIPDFVYCKNLIADTYAEKYGINTEYFLVGAEKSCAVVIENTNLSSDLKCCYDYLEILKKFGYHITAITQKDKLNADKIFDEIIIIDEDNMLHHEHRYDIALYVNHIKIWQIMLQRQQIAPIQICMLGFLTTSGFSNDYFIVPEYDNHKNYVEKLLPVSGMGCSIPQIEEAPTIKFKDAKSDKIQVCVSLTNGKMNQQIGIMLGKIEKWYYNKHRDTNNEIKDIEWILLMGQIDENNLQVRAVDKVHFAPYLKNYHIVFSSLKEYEKAMTRCSLVVIPPYYSGFMTVCDCIKYNKPYVVLKNLVDNRNASQCGAEIAKITGTGTVCYDYDSYVEMIKYAIEGIAQDKIKFLEYNREEINEKIKQHNHNISVDFGRILISAENGEL